MKHQPLPPIYDDEESSEDEHIDTYDETLSDRHSLIELTSTNHHRGQFRDISSRDSTSSRSWCSGRQKVILITCLLSILYLLTKYDVDEVKWVVTEIESDLLGSRCNASLDTLDIVTFTGPYVGQIVPPDFNFSTFTPQPNKFTEYKNGDSPYEISNELRDQSDKVARSRRFHIVNAMKHVWDNYKEVGFGMDEIRPVSGRGVDSWGGIGITLVDALDTLYIMNLKQEFDEAREWVKNNLSHTLIGEVSTSETTIHSLGGLISAYDLTDDILFLKQAEYLAPRLIKAFDSPSGLPHSHVNLRTGKSTGNTYILGEVSSLQLEFRYMSKATNKNEYHTKSERVFDILQRITPRDGLLPIHLKEKHNKAQFSTTDASFDQYSLSAYEYMLKMWIQGNKSEKKYRDFYDKSILAMHHTLLQKSSGYTYITHRTHGKVSNEMSHSTCGLAGLLALGAYTDPLGSDSPRALRDLTVAKSLGYTCYAMYSSSATGLSPGAVVFGGCNDFSIVKYDTGYGLGSGAVEGWYYLWKLTGDTVYREWGWEVFQAIEKYCKTKYGYASLKNVDLPSLHQIDEMDSSFLAKTLKYLYLLFDYDSEIDVLNKHVFSTGAHLLEVFSD